MATEILPQDFAGRKIDYLHTTTASTYLLSVFSAPNPSKRLAYCLTFPQARPGFDNLF